ncbi:TPA: hypothetical protein ACOL2D_004084 [Vibrio parahaemolyticus]
MTEIQHDIIEQALANFITDLNCNKKYAFCIRKHFNTIQELIDDGYTVKAIHNVIIKHRKLSYSTLKNSILRTRKRQLSTSQIKNKHNNTNANKTSQTIIDGNENIINIDKYSDDEWVKAWGFSLSKGLTPLMISELMKYGWTPHNYHKLKDKHNLFNSKRLIDISSDMKRHKATNKDYQ